MFLANWSQTNRHCCVNIDARGYYAGGHLHEVSIRVSRRPLTRRIGLKMSAMARIFPQTQFEFFELAARSHPLANDVSTAVPEITKLSWSLSCDYAVLCEYDVPCALLADFTT